MARALLAIVVMLVAAMPTAGFAAVGARDIGGCMDNRDVQAAIAANQIKTWPAIKRLAGVPDSWKEVSAVRVCEAGGAPYYVVNVAGPSGESKQLILNAIDGSN